MKRLYLCKMIIMDGYIVNIPDDIIYDCLLKVKI